jgi:hypothetical protein
MYRGTAKQYCVVRVQKDYTDSVAEKKGTTKQWDFWLKPTETHLSARVQNPAVCDGLNFISGKNLTVSLLGREKGVSVAMDGDAGGIIGGIDAAEQQPGSLGRYVRHLRRAY